MFLFLLLIRSSSSLGHSNSATLSFYSVHPDSASFSSSSSVRSISSPFFFIFLLFVSIFIFHFLVKQKHRQWILWAYNQCVYTPAKMASSASPRGLAQQVCESNLYFHLLSLIYIFIIARIFWQFSICQTFEFPCSTLIFLLKSQFTLLVEVLIRLSSTCLIILIKSQLSGLICLIFFVVNTRFFRLYASFCVEKVWLSLGKLSFPL